MRFWAPVLCAFGILAGFGVGLLSADPALATTDYDIEVMGGAADPDSANPNMRCGWHTSCADGAQTNGVGLDWAPYGDHQVYFRAWMYKSSGSESTVAYGYPETGTGQSCKTVWVHLASTDQNSTYRGSMTYWHVNIKAGAGQFAIVGSTSGRWNSSQFATTLTSGETCSWSGEHLHQWAYWENATGSRNAQSSGGVYPNWENPGQYYIDVKGYHQDKGSWSY